MPRIPLIKEITCRSCGGVFAMEYRTRPPELCPPCKAEAKRLRDRAKREKNLERARERNREWYHNSPNSSKAGATPVRLVAAASGLICRDCGVGFQPGGKVGRMPERCPPCATARARAVNSAKSKKYREANPERSRQYVRTWYQTSPNSPKHTDQRRRHMLRSLYGMTVQDYEAMLAAQRGGCAICGGEPSERGVLHVDHCHVSGAVRGLLCGNCNTMLGLAKDNEATLRAAIRYLKKYAPPEGK